MILSWESNVLGLLQPLDGPRGRRRLILPRGKGDRAGDLNEAGDFNPEGFIALGVRKALRGELPRLSSSPPRKTEIEVLEQSKELESPRSRSWSPSFCSMYEY